VADQKQSGLALVQDDVQRSQQQEIGQLTTPRDKTREDRFSDAKAAGERSIASGYVSRSLQKFYANRTHTPKNVKPGLLDLRGAQSPSRLRETSMFMGIAIAPIVALIAGILILFIPRLLNYIVALYLIIIGVLGLVGAFAPGVHI
jgi:hypothetical protein